MKLRPEDKRAIEEQVAEFERASGMQVVVTVAGRCDSYPEIPWRAFALGASLSALAVCMFPFAGALLYHSTVLALITVLGAGVTLALLSILLPSSMRWLLPARRSEAEVRQYAQAQFLTRGLAAAEARAILVLLALFERRGVIVADPRVLATAQLPKAESLMNVALATGDLSAAVKGALQGLRSALPSASVPTTNSLSDSVIEDRGA